MDTVLTAAFNSTIDEAVNANFRLAEITGNVSRQKWYGLALTPVFFVILFFVFDELFLQYVAGGIFALLWIPYFLLTYKKHLRKQIKKTMVRILGTDQPVPCEYQLTDEGVIFKQLGQEFKFDWKNVRQFNNRDNELELVMEPAAVALIPKRVFSGDEESQKWIDCIKDHTSARLR